MMIGIDWGTSAFRAYRLAPDGRVIAQLSQAAGILGLPPDGFAVTLRAAIDPWLALGERRVLLCGMVGSRQGWLEAPYLPCPASPAELAAAAIPLPFAGAECRLLPGLIARDAGGVPDVMRGEETKLVGLMARLGDDQALVCLPGTHSKWARVAGGRITGFATHMTGELRALLLEHGILGRLAAAGPGSDTAFCLGVRRAREAGGVLHHIFGTRALGLLGELAPSATESYLSGLLIGHEVLAAGAEGSVHLAGAAALADRYALALAALGLACIRHPDDIVADGLALLAALHGGVAGAG